MPRSSYRCFLCQVEIRRVDLAESLAGLLGVPLELRVHAAVSCPSCVGAVIGMWAVPLADSDRFVKGGV